MPCGSGHTTCCIHVSDGQVNVGAAESVKEHSPDKPDVPQKTQEEPQKPRATPQRLPAEGEPCKYEQETAEIIVIVAEGIISGMVAFPMEVVDVDEMAMLDGNPATRACAIGEDDGVVCGSTPKLQEAHRHNEDGQRNETTYLKYTECHSREGRQCV